MGTLISMVTSKEVPVPSTVELVDAIGEPAAALLIAHYHGERLYVPVREPLRREVGALIGREAAERLVDRFAGERLEFPTPKSFAAMRTREEREARIRDLRAAGESINRISLSVGVSRRHVGRVLRAG